jgi:hypothetical protein
MHWAPAQVVMWALVSLHLVFPPQLAPPLAAAAVDLLDQLWLKILLPRGQQLMYK